MIVLDTTVLSDLLREARPGPTAAWLDRQPARRVATTVVTAYGLWNGAWRLPEGARRHALEQAIARLLGDGLLGGSVLPLDAPAARAAAGIAAARARRGRAVGLADTLIAGIALARQAALATRNLRDFEDVEGLTLLDPAAA